MSVKLGDNPVYVYGVKRHWRGWRLWILPSLTLLAAAIGAAIAVVAQQWAGLGAYASALGVVTTILTRLVIPGLVPLGLTREYETGTFEMLRTTPLTTAEIAVGKLAAALSPFLLAFLATVPVSVIAVGEGEEGWLMVALTYAGGLVTMLVNVLAALYAGAHYRRAWLAILVSYVLALFLVPLIWSIALIPALFARASLTSGHVSASDMSDPVIVPVTVVAGLGLSYLFWIALKYNLDRIPGEAERQAAVMPRGEFDGGPLKTDGIARF
jgi:ABC-type transport system involved in multi-copper enzyme maturation permease subunit